MSTDDEVPFRRQYLDAKRQYPGALIINKRFANIPPGAPIFMYNWAEDSVMRERLWVPADQQGGNRELHAQTLPGEPGGTGPVSE